MKIARQAAEHHLEHYRFIYQPENHDDDTDKAQVSFNLRESNTLCLGMTITPKKKPLKILCSYDEK